MLETLLPTLTEAALPLLSLAITLAFARLTSAIKTRLDAGTARDVALELSEAAETVVRNLEQTTRPLIVATGADGKLSPGEAAELKAVALRTLRDQLSKQATELLAKNSERIDAVLSRAIEAAVQKVKQ